MTLDIYTPYQLALVREDPRQTVTTSHWLDMFFPNTFVSTQEEIAFSKLNASRRIAPFMLPNEPGKPIYRREGERIESFKPAYTKPKDAVRPSEMIALTPGEIVKREALMSPVARYNREVNRIVTFHRNSIMRLWDFMAARAILNGTLTINYGNGVAPIIDFNHDTGHTIILGAGNRWGDAGVNIFNGIQSYVDLIANAEFGGSATDIILGATAAGLALGKIPGYHDADLRDVGQIEAMMRYAESTFGGVDIVINNAGIQHVAPVEQFPVDKWNDILAINLSSVFHTTRLALPGMRQRNWGRIINIASVHGLVASKEKSAYVAAKHAVVGLTKTVALETARSGITCNAICPGWVLTPLVQQQIDKRIAEGVDPEQASAQLLAEKQPSGEFVTPQQLGEMALFLCSDAAAQVRGAAWNMDGGWVAQ